MRFSLIVVSMVSALLLAGSATAATTTYYVVANGQGLDDGHACLSSEGAGLCAAQAKFLVNSPFPITGSFTYDDGANTVDVDITLATASMTGAHDGIDEIVFTTVNYVVTGLSVMSPGAGQLFGISTPTGSITGLYEQKSGGGTLVGPSAIEPMSSVFTGFSCSNLDGIGFCGLIVGASRDFNLDVGTTGSGDSFDFVHTFNFAVQVPEPSTAGLLMLGLVTLGFAARRRR